MAKKTPEQMQVDEEFAVRAAELEAARAATQAAAKASASSSRDKK